MGIQCSTCLKLLTPGDTLTSTPCGHVFHNACILKWFIRRKNCPACRQSANVGTLRNIFLAETDRGISQDQNDLQNQLKNLKFQLREIEAENSKIAERNKEVEARLSRQKKEMKIIQEEKGKWRVQALGMKKWNEELEAECRKNEKAVKENKENQEKLRKYKSVEMALTGLDEELKQFLKERGAFDKKTEDISFLVVALKKRLDEVRNERNNFEKRLREEVTKHNVLKKKADNLEVQLAQSELNSDSLTWDLWEDEEFIKECEQERLTVSCSADVTEPLVSPSSVADQSSSSPPLSSTSRLPSSPLMGATKRSITTVSDDERSPLMPVLHHSRKLMLLENNNSRYLSLKYLYIILNLPFRSS